MKNKRLIKMHLRGLIHELSLYNKTLTKLIKFEL